MVVPDRATFTQYHRQGLRVPVALTVPTAWIPQQAFERLGGPRSQPACLLESARRHPVTGRYSFIGLDPEAVVTPRQQGGGPGSALRRIIRNRRIATLPESPRFPSGLIGYLSYEARHAIEDVPCRALRDLPAPEFGFVIVDTVVTIDHAAGVTTLATCPACDEPAARTYDRAVARLELLHEQLRAPDDLAGREEADEPLSCEASCSAGEFAQMVRRAKRYIRDGEIYQANLSLRLSCPRPRDTWALYRKLSAINPSPFAAYLSTEEVTVIGSSPERLLCADEHTVQTRPIAGTRPRSGDPQEDLARSMELMLSEKERAEHVMLVDLERNDLGRIARYGSVQVDALMRLEAYSHVLHIVSNIRGDRRVGCDAWELLAALFPGGTVTGTPKIRSMQIIDELEPVARELYTGSLGYVSDTGAMDWNIAIRTLYAVGDRLALHAGAGIVADSDPDAEYAETMAKAQAMMEAVATAPVAAHA